LCSGKGSKLWPFSDWWQKCCIPVINRANVKHLIEELKELNLSRIYVVTSYNSQMVKYFLKDEKEVKIIEEKTLGGTAQSLLSCLFQEELEHQEEDLFVVYGDIVVDRESILKVYKTFNKTNKSVVLVKRLTEDERANDWICAMTQNGVIKNIYGHPRRHYVNTRVAGVFALKKEVKKYLLANPGYMKNVCVGVMPPKESELEQSIQMMIDDGEEIIGVEVEGYYVDIDKPWHIVEANRVKANELFSSFTENIIEENVYIDSTATIQGKIRIGKGSKIGKNVIIKGDVWIGENSEINYGAIIGDKVIIGNNTLITDYAKISSYSVIGDKNRIGYNAEIDGITFEGVSTLHNSEVAGVIGSFVDIAAGCLTGSLRFDDLQTIHEIKGRKEAAGEYSNYIYIGDHTRTGVGNIFFPGIKIGINCAIGPGVIVERDIKSNSLVISEQSKVFKYWGPEKYGW
ncbi:MAG: sugar phosphate nucleotidyltransferase, partial [Caldanaerobacter sp.]